MSSTLQTHLGFEVFFFFFARRFALFSFGCAVQFFVYEILINFLCTRLIYIRCLLWRTHIKRYMDKSHNEDESSKTSRAWLDRYDDFARGLKIQITTVCLRRLLLLLSTNKI